MCVCLCWSKQNKKKKSTDTHDTHAHCTHIIPSYSFKNDNKKDRTNVCMSNWNKTELCIRNRISYYAKVDGTVLKYAVVLGQVTNEQEKLIILIK